MPRGETTTRYAALWTPSQPIDATVIFGITIVGFAIAGVLAAVFSARTFAAWLLHSVSALGVSVLYFGCEALFQKLVPGAGIRLIPQYATLIFVLDCFALLYLMQAIVHVNPSGRLARVLYPWFYAGLYMDELFTRATFRIWPAKQSMEVLNRRDATLQGGRELVNEWDRTSARNRQRPQGNTSGY